MLDQAKTLIDYLTYSVCFRGDPTWIASYGTKIKTYNKAGLGEDVKTYYVCQFPYWERRRVFMLNRFKIKNL